MNRYQPATSQNVRLCKTHKLAVNVFFFYIDRFAVIAGKMEWPTLKAWLKFSLKNRLLETIIGFRQEHPGPIRSPEVTSQHLPFDHIFWPMKGLCKLQLTSFSFVIFYSLEIVIM